MLLDLFGRFVAVGDLTVIDARGRVHRFGGAPGPSATVRLHDPAIERGLILRPELTIGEAYVDGTLTLEEGSTLYDLLDIGIQSFQLVSGRGLLGLARPLVNAVARLDSFNPVSRAGGKVRRHYDLDPPLFDLFLDSDKQYSCAYFRSPADTLETAQRQKKAHLARKLHLSPGQSVLDIGSGWGGLGLYLAREHGVRVTGVTLSREQHAESNRRARDAGLAGAVSFELKDYRAETGRYDRVVSVGMLEHVGKPHYREFFAKVAGLLAEDGVAVIHTIGRYNTPGPINPWIRKYIFPGAYVPTLSELSPAIEESGLLMTDIEILRLHYAETLRAWQANFQRNRAEVLRLKDDAFVRMWEFYLTACELGFRRKELMVLQIQLARSVDSLPQTRDYMYLDEDQAAERRPVARAS